MTGMAERIPTRIPTEQGFDGSQKDWN
jgi:hypothetical protein